MFDKLLGNLDDMAARLGLPADQVKSMTESLQTKLGEGGDPLSALAELAGEHGLSLDKLQGLASGLGGEGEGLLGQLGGMLGGDGDTPGAADLMDMAKGLFGQK